MCKIYKKAMVIIVMAALLLILGFNFGSEKVEAIDIQNITAASVQITAPVLGAVFQNAEAVQVATNNADFTVTDLTWNEPLTTGGKFKAGQVYTTTVTLTSKNGKKFQSEAFTPTVAGSISVGTTTTSGEEVGNTVSFTVTYAATGDLAVSSIAITNQPTKMSYIETTDGVLALNGMQITEVNNDGSTRIVSFTDETAAEYTSTPANGTVLTNSAHNGHPVTITHTVSGKTANTNNLTVAVYVPPTPVTDYDVWVGGIRVTSANMGDVLGAADEGATVTYTPATGSLAQTLSMSGATITGAYTEEHVSYGRQNYTIYAKGDLNIVLTGDNTVTGEGPIDSYGINTTGALTISGTGSLTTSGASGVDIDISYGIRSYGNITITSGTVTASGGDAECNSRGIGGNGVTISGGTVSATAGDGDFSFGLDGSDIIISGGTVSASGKVGTSGGLNLSGGTVELSGRDNAIRENDGFVYSNGIVSASTRSDGYNAGPYNSANKNSYKYLYYEPASPLTGTVTISGIPKYGQTLTATYNHGNSTGTLSYQWKIGGNIRGTNSTYTLVEEDINKSIVCIVKSTKQTGYVMNISSIIATKADGPAITSVSTVGCTTPENNDGKLIGMTTTMEYKRSSNASYTSVTGSAITVTGSAITGLTSGDYMVRFSETDTHNAGPHSIFNIAAFIPAPTYTISGNIIGNDTNSGIAGAIVQLKSGGSNIRSSLYTDSSGAYTISDVIAGTYTIEVSAAGYDRGITNSFNVSSADITSNDLTLTKTVVFIPVTDITMTNGIFVRVYNNLNLTGTTIPSNASNCTITWSVDDANGTGAIITGNTFRATSEGIATVKATVINGFSVSSDYNKTFTIAVTAAPTPTPNPSPSPTLRPVERPEGIVEKDKQQEEGAPTINVNNSSDELKTSVLTQAEQVLVARGENAKIILKVTDISSSISEEEKKLIQDKLLVENGKEKKEVDEKEAPEIAVLYIDLTLYKQIGSREQTKVTETNEKISISLEIPEEFWNTDVMKSREFYVMRIHDGEITRIDGSYDAIKQIFTFETDRFSTYALTYQDTIRITTYKGFRYLQLRVKTDKTSQILSYKRNGIVDGYLIFGGKCGEEMVELADIPAKITRYVIDDLMPRTFYKYQVKAYRIVDGERIIIMTSKVVHSILNGKTYADPKRVTLDMKSIKLTKDENKAITGQLVLPKGKKLKAHTAVIRFESSNSEIASVNSKGNISGKSEGTCYVYAYAQNGVYKRIKVTVK